MRRSRRLGLAPPATVVDRIAGNDRFATAVAASVSTFPATASASAVVLASGDSFPDALVGVTLTASLNAPLLLTSGATLPSVTKTEILRVLPAGGTVYLLGGTASVPNSIASQLSSMGYHTTRYAGSDRFGTALAVAAALGNPTTVMLVDGSTFADALAAGPAAAHVHAAVLLTNGSSLPAADAAYLAAHHGTVYAHRSCRACGRCGRDPGVRRWLVEQHKCGGGCEVLPGSDRRGHRD